MTSLDDFNSYFSSEFEDDDIETIGGYLINQFERVPGISEVLHAKNLSFKVLSADSKKIKRIQVIIEANGQD